MRLSPGVAAMAAVVLVILGGGMVATVLFGEWSDPAKLLVAVIWSVAVGTVAGAGLDAFRRRTDWFLPPSGRQRQTGRASQIAAAIVVSAALSGVCYLCIALQSLDKKAAAPGELHDDLI